MFRPRVAGELQEHVLEGPLDRPDLVHRETGADECSVQLRSPSRIDRHLEHAAVEAHVTDVGPLDDRPGLFQRLGPDEQAGRAAQLRDGPLGDHPTPVDHHRPVADLFDLGEQVAREQHRPALLGLPADERAHLHCAVRVEAARRLVEDQQRRILEQGGGDTEPLPHAGGVAVHLVPGPFEQPHLVEYPPDARRAYTCIAGEGPQVVAAGQVRVEGGRLHQRADSGERFGGAGRLAEQGRAARSGPHQPQQHAQRRRLAGAVGPEEADHLAPLDGQVQPVDGDVVAVALREAGGLDHGGHGASWRFRRSSSAWSRDSSAFSARRPRRVAATQVRRRPPSTVLVSTT
jgi:hypothetical protein